MKKNGNIQGDNLVPIIVVKDLNLKQSLYNTSLFIY
jgi:hypothetical protein